MHCETLGDNFWYRACYRANQILDFLNPNKQISIKAQIVKLMGITSSIPSKNRIYARLVSFVSTYLAEIQDIKNYTIGHTWSKREKTHLPISFF